jgi:hypothetical protein
MIKFVTSVLLGLGLTSVTLAQDHIEHTAADGTPTRAVGVWLPTAPGECTKEMHDRYVFTDPDTGEQTAVWHAETDSTGCRYHPHDNQFATHIPTVLPDPIKNSMAMGLWKPSTDTVMHPNECTQEEHDSYHAVFEGKRYPIWHPLLHVRSPAVEAGEDSPAIPATTCILHDHGQDPATSPLHDPERPILFGYVNEMMMSSGIMMPRHEDHVGHKIVVAEQGFSFDRDPAILTCQTLTKFHQGTHSPDALTNNLHEVVKIFACPGGVKVRIQAMAAVGRAGWIEQNGTPNAGLDIFVGTPTPPDSPIVSNPHIGGDSLGDRDMPTPATMYISRPVTFEQWRFQLCIMSIGEGYCSFRIADYWSVSNPSRFYDPAKPNKMARTIDACWLKDIDDTWVVDFGGCLIARKYNITRWDDPRSPFNGTQRGLRQDNWEWRNITEVRYTDPLGMKASLVPVPGVSEIRQEISVGSFLIPGTNRARRLVTRVPGVNGTAPVLTGARAPN